MSELNYIGKSMRRKAGPDKVTGKAVYTQDVRLPNTLIGRLLRSPHPHARIVRIDTTRAMALPRGKGVTTAEAETEGAMRPDAPQIHPSHPKAPREFSNIGGTTETQWGDVERGFAESDYVREDRFECQLRTHGSLEPQVTLAHWEHDKLNVWTSSMGAFVKRAKLAKTLDLPYSSVRIHKTYVGGTFGGEIV